MVCFANGMPDGGLPCSVFASYEKALRKCLRLAAAKMNQKIRYWQDIRGDDAKGMPMDIFLNETGKGVAVCRRFHGKHDITFEVEDEIFYLKPFRLDRKTQREWL